MSTLRSDSLLTKQIVRSFLRFLSSVELTPEIDAEAVIVASQCLGDAFGVEIPTFGDSVEPDLVQLFKQSGHYGATREFPDIPHSEAVGHKPFNPKEDIASPSQPVDHKPFNPKENIAGPSHPPKNPFSTYDAAAAGGVEERLFEQFKEGLESAGYFDGLSGDIHKFEERLERSKNLFVETLKKIIKPGITEQIILAETFKAQGNTSMANSHFNEAIDLYTMAISLCGDNAVYYSNRAAAHTQIGKFEAAIADSNKAIQLDPNYSKAYSRLGLAYYTQGKYQEAIEKGFQKAHQLDPNSKSIQENLLVAQKRLEEEHARSRQSNSEPCEHQPHTQSNNQGSEAQYSTTIPLNVQLPQEMASLFPSVANLAAQFVGDQAGPGEDGMHGIHINGQPEVRMDGNMNVTVEGEPQFAGLMQSMLQMFAGASNQNRSEQANPNPNRSEPTNPEGGQQTQ